MKKVILLIVCSIGILYAQSGASYYSRNNFNLTSPGAMKFGLYGYDNPALLAAFNGFDLQYSWTADKSSNSTNWGIFAAFPNLGFSAIHNKFHDASVTEYKLATAFGSNSFGLGFSYGWTTGQADFFGLANSFSTGLFYRPVKYLSLGITGYFPNHFNKEAVIDMAVRPFGNEFISVFADYVVKKEEPNDIKYSAGISVEAYPGVRVTGRYYENKFFNVGVNLSLGNLGFTSQGHFSENGNSSYQTYSVRLGSYDRNPLEKIMRGSKYVEMNLLGELKYQRYQFLDNSNTLFEILDAIKTAKNDPSVSGIAINTSGMNINREMLWEIRSSLKEFRNAGKKVFIYIDRVNIDGYHFATVADKIILDQQGSIILEGYASGRSYYAGMLDKIGIGFTELRYFKYKSALESFSRTEMSEGEKEQRLALINDLYYVAKEEICKSRNISPENFEKFVNDNLNFSPAEALENGLVDKLGRWEDVKTEVNDAEGKNIAFIPPFFLEQYRLPDDNYWGNKPTVAVIYALGPCAMDDGITARKLVNDVRYAVENSSVKAIVLRVDSPGGDALASDIIAEELKKAKGKKPIIVSQGYVAGSGGYWLSMYGDTIIAAPQTITGSIGVISGWYYNKTLKEKLGITTDKVQIGEHSDLMTGMALPLINMVVLPDRDFSDKEKNITEKAIRDMYKDFVTKVAEGRNKTYDEIDKIGEGHFYSGLTGYKIGLVDLIGSLKDAVSLAVKKAGLKNGEYKIIELPEPQMFNFNSFLPGFLNTEMPLIENETLKDIKFRLQNNGKVMPLLPAGIE